MNWESIQTEVGRSGGISNTGLRRVTSLSTTGFLRVVESAYEMDELPLGKND